MANETIMLAKPFKDKLVDKDAKYMISEKLDGVPVCIKHNGTEWEALSRQGKPITSIPHILKDVEATVSPREEVIGELYMIGEPFAKISGAVRKQEPNEAINLYLFPRDIPFDGAAILCDMSDYVHRLNHFYVSGVELAQAKDAVSIMFQHARYMQCTLNDIDSPYFEGLIAMKCGAGWQAGKRSNGYLKLLNEPTLDLLVVSLEEATTTKDTYDTDELSPTFGEVILPKGTPLGRVGAFVCTWNTGACRVGAGKLSHAQAEALWSDRANWLRGRKIIEAKYKADPTYDKPRQPTFQRFRSDKDTWEEDFTGRQHGVAGA